MNCEWQGYLRILPHWMRQEVDAVAKDLLQELHLRINLPPEAVLKHKNQLLRGMVTQSDLHTVINLVTSFSPWTSETASQGFLTAEGGHRVGISGRVINQEGNVRGIPTPTSLCIRVAREYTGISERVASINDSILILGPPGSGKTTFLRDLVRAKSYQSTGNISVVDERMEIFPMAKGKFCFDCGPRTDVLSGCKKEHGMECVLRSMNPEWIAVDEISSGADCNTMLQAGWCGIKLIATAHAHSLDEFLRRPFYRAIAKSNLFAYAVVMERDKSWKLERLRT